MGKEKEEGEEEEEEECRLWYQVPSQDFLSFQFYCQRIRVDNLRGERDQGRVNRTPIDPLSCYKRCEQSSGTSSTQARGGSPARQIEKNMFSVQGAFPIDYASRRQRPKACKLHNQN